MSLRTKLEQYLNSHGGSASLADCCAALGVSHRRLVPHVVLAESGKETSGRIVARQSGSGGVRLYSPTFQTGERK